MLQMNNCFYHSDHQLSTIEFDLMYIRGSEDNSASMDVPFFNRIK